MEPMETKTRSHKQAVRNAFGALAALYDSWYDTPLGEYVWVVETAAIRTMLPSDIDGVVVDLGVGTGMSIELLSKYHMPTIGIDFSWRMLQVAYQKTRNEIQTHLILADGEKQPLRQGIAELILGMTVLEFVPNPQQLLREIHTTLKKNGWVILGVLSSTSLWAIERRLKNLNRPDVFTYAKCPSPWQLIRLFRSESFSEVEYHGSVYAPSFTPDRFLSLFIRLDEKWGKRWLSRALGAFLVLRARSSVRSQDI